MSEQTPALALADLLAAVAGHLRNNPDLPPVNVARDGWLQIATYPHRGETADGARAVLMWAVTLTDPVIRIRPPGSSNATGTTVRAVASIAGSMVDVWDVDHGDLDRWCGEGDTYGYTTIGLDQLAAYSAAGTVDGVS